jgi:HSP20 family protein
MRMIRCNPWVLLRDIHEEANQLFDQKMVKEANAVCHKEEKETDLATHQWVPRTDIKTVGNQYIILTDLPGISPDEIEISVEKNVLTLKGERKSTSKVEGENYSRQERFTGTFCRRFTLPEDVDSEQIGAKSKHGVLEIILPKKEELLSKKIDIQVKGE